MSDVNRHHNRVNRGIRKVARFYRRRMSPLIRWRWVFLPLMLLLLLSTLLVIPYVGLELYADDSLSFFFVRIWMPEGASIEETDQVARAIEEVAMTLPREEVISVVTQVGRLDTESDRIFSKDVAMVKVDLVEPTARERSLEEIMAELESRTSHVTGFRRIEFAKISGGPPLGRPIEVKVKGTYFEDLERLSNRLKDYLATIPGVHSIQDDLEKGKNELRVRIDESRAHLVGLDKSDIARQIKYAFEGIPATVFHDGDEEVDVVVRFRPENRSSIQDVYDLYIPSARGGLVPFSNVANFTVERGWASVNRFDGERAVTVSADVSPDGVNAVQATQMLRDYFQQIAPEFPGYRLDFRGEFQEFEEAFQNVGRLFLIGLILIYLILGAQFRSYIQPLLVMCSIPFAFAGAMLYLLVSGYPFSIMVMYGMVALAGVVVNDSIVLIDFVNNARRRGASAYRAVLTAAKRRLRPIFLTTATTIFGLLPMALGVGGRSVVWIPLAGTIVVGLGMATFLILLIIPPLYLAIEDVRRFFGFSTPAISPAASEEPREVRVPRFG